MRRRRFMLSGLALAAGSSLRGDSGNVSRSFKKIAEWKAEEAHQGVAVDQDHFYAVETREIGKYDKRTGSRVALWDGNSSAPVVHLDSGVVVDGKLYCSHSNYPAVPMTSSVEVWDCATLEHVSSYSFGIRWGSCTWIDRHAGSWWAAFSHYGKLTEQLHTDNRWTTVVHFDDHWQPGQSWIFPPPVLERFLPGANSGGSWGPDGLLYVTGHDNPELYAMRLPAFGSELKLEGIVPVDNLGQGIAWDRSDSGVLYTIKRSERTVGTHRLSTI